MSTKIVPYFPSKEQIDKVGNALIYLSKYIPNLSKTKALKLLYILDEFSIKKSGIPFFNLSYETWKLGPVSKEIYIDINEGCNLLGKYITANQCNNGLFIEPVADFNDDEFSDNDIELLDNIIEYFRNSTASELIDYTHRNKSPWKETAIKHSVLDSLENGELNNTNYPIDMTILIKHDENKLAIYKECLDFM